MKKLLTNGQMRAADENTIYKMGIPSEALMERAGKALFGQAQALLHGGRVLCVCGGGNNGGDGFICARLLRAAGYEVDLVCIAERYSDDCAMAKEKYIAACGEILMEFPEKRYGLVIDCLLGTGFHGALSAAYEKGIKRINGYKADGAKVLSADIPSGVNGDNGRVQTVAVCADTTVCMGEYKAGVLLGEGIDHAGRLVRADIGIALPLGEYAVLTEREDVRELLPMRKRNTHKGSYGKAAIVAGSNAYMGAAYLATAACLRAGAGYTTLFTPKGLLPYYRLKAPEALLRPLCEGEEPIFEEESFSALLAYEAIAYGMGMGNSEETAKGAAYLLKHYTGKLILDADGLNALAQYTQSGALFREKKCDVVITPHIKELSRLSKESVSDILDRGVFAPAAYARENGINVYLKNAVSLLTDGQRIFVNDSGNAGQAKGGSGDVLAGVMAGLCAQGFSTLDGARIGGYLVGKAAEIAAERVGEYSLIASDIIDNLGRAFLWAQTD